MNIGDSLVVVRLDDNQTKIECDKELERAAVRNAFRVTLSPCEWTWTPSETAELAQYVLWAHQRLCAIEQCVSGDLKHAKGVVD